MLHLVVPHSLGVAVMEPAMKICKSLSYPNNTVFKKKKKNALLRSQIKLCLDCKCVQPIA